MVKGSGGPADLEAGRLWLGKAVAQGHIRAQKSLLRVELREAGSLFGKLSVWLKIVSLTKKEAREMLRDPRSDKLY
jgi:TPR repeat protein